MPVKGDLPPTKTIIVYRNGDAFFPGRKIVVNPRQVANFDNFMTSLTGCVEAPSGAVRKLFTPRQGHKVRRLDDLTHGGVYVAAGNEPFKKLDLFTNGEVLVPPARLRIPKHTLRSWDNVLAMVTEKVHLRTGAVFRLYTLDGHRVCGPAELQNNHHYVAVGAEKFKALPYDQLVPSRDLSRENHMIEGEDILPAVRKTRRAKAAFAHTGFGGDFEHTSTGQIKKHAAEPDGSKQRRQISRIFPTGEGSVFNAQNKRSEMAGATEVQEDGQLKVDLPIDQVEAKIVDEEFEDGRCAASPHKASLRDSDGLCLPNSLSAGSRKDEAKEREVSSSLCRIRSRMSRVFKELRCDTAEVPRGANAAVNPPSPQLQSHGLISTLIRVPLSFKRFHLHTRIEIAPQKTLLSANTSGFDSMTDEFAIVNVKRNGLLHLISPISHCETWYHTFEISSRDKFRQRTVAETGQREIDGLIGLQHLFCYKAHSYQTMAKYDCPGASHVNVKDKHRSSPVSVTETNQNDEGLSKCLKAHSQCFIGSNFEFAGQVTGRTSEVTGQAAAASLHISKLFASPSFSVSLLRMSLYGTVIKVIIALPVPTCARCDSADAATLTFHDATSYDGADTSANETLTWLDSRGWHAIIPPKRKLHVDGAVAARSDLEAQGERGRRDNVCQQTLTGLYHNEVSVLEKLEAERLIVLHREHTFLQLVNVSGCMQACWRGRKGRGEERDRHMKGSHVGKMVVEEGPLKHCSHYALPGEKRQSSGNEMTPLDLLSCDIFVFQACYPTSISAA
ncbi:hypothetical protein PAMA_003866 [Pampus argenteus]